LFFGAARRRTRGTRCPATRPAITLTVELS